MQMDELPYTRQLLEIMAKLRDPQGGCPWDVEQDFASIAPYTLEEAYEVAEAIAQNDMTMLRSELGDLLLQVVFHAQMADEKELFDFEQVALAICEKLISRHPHVFGNAEINSAEQQTQAWEEMKDSERKARNEASLMDDIPLALPALLRAHKIQKRAARVGFDWQESAPVMDKVEEELGEVKEAIASGDQEHVAEEIGDLLFAVANLARHHGMRSEETLRAANEKFIKRFRMIEQLAEQKDMKLRSMNIEQMEALWVEVKKR